MMWCSHDALTVCAAAEALLLSLWRRVMKQKLSALTSVVTLTCWSAAYQPSVMPVISLLSLIFILLLKLHVSHFNARWSSLLPSGCDQLCEPAVHVQRHSGKQMFPHSCSSAHTVTVIQHENYTITHYYQINHSNSLICLQQDGHANKDWYDMWSSPHYKLFKITLLPLHRSTYPQEVHYDWISSLFVPP